ncbi:MAG TPA: gluconate 2-dehydrogenase subunit 3 family protein, partial [Gammaproteobacteria bacterium]
GGGFMASSPAQRVALLERLDREAIEYMRRPGADARPHYFRMIKELTLLGYFTSEIGCTQALRYTEVPGRFEPCVTYTAGEKAWAGHA